MKRSAGITDKIRRIFLICAFLFGLLAIVGTSDDEKSSSDSDTDTPTSTDTNTVPVAAITVPSDASSFNEGALLTFAGSGTDTEDGALTGAALYWSSSIDGRIGIGATISEVSLSPGTHTITFTVTDKEGAAHASIAAITINPDGNTLPTIEITAPSDKDTFSAGEYITFTGTGTDTEDGDLIESSLTWTSNKNKMIGVGTSFETAQLTSGEHIITLTGTDSDNTRASTSITISVKNTLPTATISWPADGDTFDIGEPIICNGTGYDAEDGELGGSSLIWRVNGTKVGEGNSCSIDYLTTAGNYKIALHVTDGVGEIDVDSIEIKVEDPTATTTP